MYTGSKAIRKTMYVCVESHVLYNSIFREQISALFSCPIIRDQVLLNGFTKASITTVIPHIYANGFEQTSIKLLDCGADMNDNQHHAACEDVI